MSAPRHPQPNRRAVRSCLVQMIRRLPGGNALLAWYRQTRVAPPDAYLISFPKCGRTWLRLMMGVVIDTAFGIEREDLLNLEKTPRNKLGVPRVQVTHDDDPQLKKPTDLSTDKSAYRGKKVIFLARDPRDVVVSNFFQKTRRDFDYEGDLPSYLRSEIGSLSSLIAWYNIWAANFDLPAALLLVFYEDLLQDPLAELRRVVRFLGLLDIDETILEHAVAFSSFDNMRRLEATGAFASVRLRPGDPTDPESFKVRRGRAGGYSDYLCAEDLAYLESRLVAELSDFFSRYK